MRRTWLLFWQTYWSNITRKSYLFFTFGLPFILVAIPVGLTLALGLVVFLMIPPPDPNPVGIVDASGLFAEVDLLDEPVPMQSFVTVAEAEAAFSSGELQAYYYIPPDYWETGEIILYYDHPPTEEVRGMVERWVRRGINAFIPDDIRPRYFAGATIEHRGAQVSDEAFTENDMSQWLGLFALIYFVRMAGVFTSGYMYDSIASEARNRTIEIILTSVKPLQFVAGKLLGLLLVGLTQLFVWGGGMFLLAWSSARLLGSDWGSRLTEGGMLGWVIGFLLGAYVLDQIIAACAGMLRVSGGAGPQLFNTASWVMGVALIYAIYFVPNAPDTLLTVGASLFPLTAPIVMPTRLVASVVPAWQVWLSMGLLWGTAVASLFLLRRLLERNMLGYGSRFSLRRWVRRHISRQPALQKSG